MYQLYFSPGNASLAPHFLLEEIGAPYELMFVDKTLGEHQSASYLQLNPNGRIPTFVDGTHVMFESAAICLHLADKHPECELAPLPATPERGTYYKWMMFLTNTVQAHQMIYFHPESYTDKAEAFPALVAQAEINLNKSFQVIEEALMAQGPHLLGPKLSGADFFLFMLARWGRNLHRPPRALPAIGKLLQLLNNRLAVQKVLQQENLSQPYF